MYGINPDMNNIEDQVFHGTDELEISKPVEENETQFVQSHFGEI